MLEGDRLPGAQGLWTSGYLFRASRRNGHQREVDLSLRNGVKPMPDVKWIPRRKRVASRRWRWARHMLLAVALLLCAACASNSNAPSRAPTATAVLSTTWKALLQRPLQLPSLAQGATCPKMTGHQVSPEFGLVQGDGPVYSFLGIGSAIGVMQASVLQQVLWVVASSYSGPVLIRGHQLDGSAALTFEGGLDQADYQGNWRDAPPLSALRLMVGTQHGASWSSYPTYVNVPAHGCYGFQVDGQSFSYALIVYATEIEY